MEKEVATTTLSQVTSKLRVNTVTPHKSMRTHQAHHVRAKQAKTAFARFLCALCPHILCLMCTPQCALCVPPRTTSQLGNGGSSAL